MTEAVQEICGTRLLHALESSEPQLVQGTITRTMASSRAYSAIISSSAEEGVTSAPERAVVT